MAKLPFGKNSMHIKRSTEGTSNEISFSVLDAKKNSTDEAPTNSPRTVSELGKVSLFTIPGKQSGETAPTASGFAKGASRGKRVFSAGSGQTSLVGHTEVAQRKQRRRASRLLNITAVLVVLGVLIVAGTRALDGFLERQQSNQLALRDAIALLEQTDAAVVSLDEAIAAPANSDQHSYDQVLADLAAATSLLDRATNSAELVIKAQESEQLVEVASQVKESALARKDLAEKGRTVLVQGSAAKTASDLLEQAWQTTLDADAVAKEAAALLEGESARNATQSSELSTQAMNGFQEALTLLRQARQAYPRADLSAFENYLELRSAAQQNALASNAAILEQDRATAQANSAAYNASEEEAATLAAQLPENPAQPVIDRYNQLGGAADAAYQDARTRVARADAGVRDYLEQG